jgi:hypothetical protein
MGSHFAMASKIKNLDTRPSGDAKLMHILTFELSIKLNIEPKDKITRMWVSIELCLFSVLGN